MLIPTAPQVETVLMTFVKRFLWGIPFLLVAACQKWIAEFLQDISSQSLAQLTGWLFLVLTLVTSIFLFYLHQYRVMKKALLKVNPDYFFDKGNDRIWVQVKRDREKTNPK